MEVSDAFMWQRTVHTWLAHLQRQTQLAPPGHRSPSTSSQRFVRTLGKRRMRLSLPVSETPQRGKMIHRRNRQHYAAQIDAFQRQVAGDRRQQVQYGRVVRSF